jgi:hypothetical protein
MTIKEKTMTATNGKRSIKAIETAYNGYLFRSRLEARWAVFFDAAGLLYQYEPQGFDLDGLLYLPDFWFPELCCWVEIKPGTYRKGWYQWDSVSCRYRHPDNTSAPVMPPEFYDDLTKIHRLALASENPVYLLFDDLCHLHFDDEERIVGSNKAWYPDGDHIDGCCEWGECPLCRKIGFGHHAQHQSCACRCSHPFAAPLRPGDWGRCARCQASDYTQPEERGTHRPWMKCDSERLLKAYRAARSARFEHGQTPRRR